MSASIPSITGDMTDGSGGAGAITCLFSGVSRFVLSGVLIESVIIEVIWVSPFFICETAGSLISGGCTR